MTREVFGPGVCVCVCVCDESPMCPVGYRLYRGRVMIENAFNLCGRWTHGNDGIQC